MKLGFIGTGKIASAVITGICTSKISFQKIIVSPRNRNIAQKLKKRFRKVNIAKYLKIDHRSTILVYKGSSEVSRTLGQVDKSIIYSNIKKGI